MISIASNGWANRPSLPPLRARLTSANCNTGEQTKIQISFSYSDGFGREIQKKIQAEPGLVPQRDATVRLSLARMASRC